MRIRLVIPLLLLMTTVIWAQGTAPTDGDSDGKLEVSSKDHLLYLSENSGADWTADYEQTADISFSSSDFESGGDFYNGGSGFSPIGNNSTSFTGSYDGQDYTISDLTIDRSTTNNIGLFGSTNGAAISNVGLVDVSISGQYYVGALVGWNDNSSTVQNSYATGSVSGSNNDVGGLVGRNNMSSTVQNSYATGSVSGDSYIGGLVGYNNVATVQKSYATGSVTGSSSVGGLVGGAWSSTVNNSFWNSDSASTSNGGTGKTTSEMKTLATFTDENTTGLDAAWDFANTPNDDAGNDDYWDIHETVNNGYPFLSWQEVLKTPSGSGTSGDPYLIAGLGNLNWISQSSDKWDKYYKQTADIDASATSGWDGSSGWTPIGNLSTRFTGEYDGDGHTIDSLYISRSGTNYIGLFGYSTGATVKNIGVTNVDLTGDSRVGGVMGNNYNGSTVQNSYATGSVTGSSSVGGLVGFSDLSSTIQNSYATSSVSGGNRVGGLLGSNYNSSTVQYSYAIGSVSGSSSVGGLVGYDAGGTTSNSFWNTTTSGQSSSSGGTGKSTTEMKTLATFTDENTSGLTTAWDFETNPNDDSGADDYWDMDLSGTINSGYPFLSWQNGGDISLPVKLAVFTGQYTKDGIRLTWITESEIGNLGFILERRAAEGNSWQPLASFKDDPALQGHGSTSQRHTYTFTDPAVQPGDTYYYRLSDVSTEGKVTVHSDRILMITTAGGAQAFHVSKPYPNPFNPVTTLRYTLPEAGPLQVTVYNLEGQLVDVIFNQPQDAGSHTLTISLPDYASGVYFMQLTTPQYRKTQKVLLLK